MQHVQDTGEWHKTGVRRTSRNKKKKKKKKCKALELGSCRARENSLVHFSRVLLLRVFSAQRDKRKEKNQQPIVSRAVRSPAIKSAALVERKRDDTAMLGIAARGGDR
jgi:hypothetical protein